VRKPARVLRSFSKRARCHGSGQNEHRIALLQEPPVYSFVPAAIFQPSQSFAKLCQPMVRLGMRRIEFNRLLGGSDCFLCAPEFGEQTRSLPMPAHVPRIHRQVVVDELQSFVRLS